MNEKKQKMMNITVVAKLFVDKNDCTFNFEFDAFIQLNLTRSLTLTRSSNVR